MCLYQTKPSSSRELGTEIRRRLETKTIWLDLDVTVKSTKSTFNGVDTQVTDRQTDRHRQRHWPVVEQYVWSPDHRRRQTNATDVAVLALIPTQFVIPPFLPPPKTPRSQLIGLLSLTATVTSTARLQGTTDEVAIRGVENSATIIPFCSHITNWCRRCEHGLKIRTIEILYYNFVTDTVLLYFALFQ